MRANQPSSSDPPSVDRGAGSLGSRTSARSEDIYVRNYDPTWGYDLKVTALGSGDEPVFESRYYCQPGEGISVENVLAPAEYEVCVELDNRHEVRAECRVSSAPEHTIHVELGNGTVSLSEGLY